MLRAGVLRVTTVVRPAVPGDLGAVESLLRASELPTAEVGAWLERFVIAEDEGRVVAVAGLEIHGDDGVLRSVAVAPDLRGGGLGARLTEAVIARAREDGLRSLYLLTTTAADYFPRHGFRRIERSQASPAIRQSVEFREACPASAVAMVRDLGRRDTE